MYSHRAEVGAESPLAWYEEAARARERRYRIGHASARRLRGAAEWAALARDVFIFLLGGLGIPAGCVVLGMGLAWVIAGGPDAGAELTGIIRAQGAAVGVCMWLAGLFGYAWGSRPRT